MAITFNNTVYGARFVGQDDGAPAASFGIDNVSANNITINGTVSAVGDPVTATGLLPGSIDTGNTATTNTLYVTQFENSGMVQFSDQAPANQSAGAANRYVVSNSALAPGQRATFNNDTSLTQYQPVCFATGTRIRTSRGDVAVEDLSVGDLAITSSDTLRPIRWIGSRMINCARCSQPSDVMPVRIRAGALGENRPVRDLVVSPGHSICIDVAGEVLIPASALVNGSTIVQEDVDSVTYWHVELDSHDLLVAEGQAAESYLDMGNRLFFGQGTVIDLHTLPDVTEAAARTHADFCRPFHSGGVLVEVVRAQLGLRAEALGWTRDTQDTWVDVHLEVDGRIVQPNESNGLTASFVLPANAKDVWLVSPTSVPFHVGVNASTDALGLCLSDLSLYSGNMARTVAVDDPLLCVGFFPMWEGHRWTAGRARLPAALLSGMTGEVILRLDLANPSLPRWMPPVTAMVGETAPAAPRLSLVA